MRSITTLLATTAVLAFSLTGQADPVPKEKVKTTEEKLLGKWNLVKQRGTEVNDIWIEFEKGGKLKLHYGLGMGNVTYEGKYKVLDKDVIDYSVDMNGDTHGEKLKIVLLNDKELKTEDEDKVLEEFERAKPDEKKDEKKEEKKP